MSAEKKLHNCQLEFWGGLECTINRVENSYFDQFHFSGHYDREADINLVSQLGIKVLRYPVLWEKHQSYIDETIDWTDTTRRLDDLKKNGITPIMGLLHHGSGPQFTSLIDKDFPELFAAYARKVAEKFPWIQYYTPINEPLTTARFSGLYGLWYPHKANDVSFAKMLLNQVKGIILAMEEIRAINPKAMLVQTEDLSKTYSTPQLKHQANFENERRWLTYDLLCGKVLPGTAMWKYFIRLGITIENLNFFIEHAFPPDIMGFNYYITSERFLDDDVNKYPPYTHGGNEIQEYADVEAIRVNHGNPFGLTLLLKEAWDRYKLPIAITEAHLNAGREDQLRWLNEIVRSCRDALDMGIDVKAVTFWSLFGAYGWNRLLTSESMDYEPGAFDLRSDKPRTTAVSTLIKDFINEQETSHPLLNQKGWWHQPSRFYHKKKFDKHCNEKRGEGKPIIITGKTGTLGQAIARICKYRNIPFILTGRDELNISDDKNIQAFLDAHKPWAVINTAGYVRVDDAEGEPDVCFNINTTGAILLSGECGDRNISFVTISSDLVFDGRKNSPYTEFDSTSPLNVYGASKVKAEENILKENPDALIIRTSAFFGPWDKYNFAINVLNSLADNNFFIAPDNITISPTYVPHLAEGLLDLLIDNEKGIWHLTNNEAVTWKEFAVKIAETAGYDPRFVKASSFQKNDHNANLPLYSALTSHKACLLPSLEHAIHCFFKECTILPTRILKPQF